MAGWKQFVEGTTDVLKVGGKIIKGVGQNWKGVGAAIVGWNYFINDKSLVEQAGGFVLGEDAVKDYKEKGVLGVGENVALGREGAEKFNAGIAQAVDTAGNAVKSFGQGASQVYHNGVQMVSDMFNPGVPQAAGTYPQGVDDPVMQQALMQQAAMQQYQDQGNGFSSLFSGVGDAAGSVLSGGRGLSLAALIPAAWLMFGNFGWMGKIASFLLGNFALKNMKAQQSMMSQPQVAMSPQMQQQFQRQLQENFSRNQQVFDDQDSGNVILRNRV